MRDQDSKLQREVANQRLNRFLESTERFERFVQRDTDGSRQPSAPVREPQADHVHPKK